jgi:hypothetical protein
VTGKSGAWFAWFAMLSCVVFFGFQVWSGLARGRIYGRYGGAKRADSPISFWIGFAGYTAMFLISVVASLAVLVIVAA